MMYILKFDCRVLQVIMYPEVTPKNVSFKNSKHFDKSANTSTYKGLLVVAVYMWVGTHAYVLSLLFENDIIAMNKDMKDLNFRLLFNCENHG